MNKLYLQTKIKKIKPFLCKLQSGDGDVNLFLFKSEIQKPQFVFENIAPD